MATTPIARSAADMLRKLVAFDTTSRNSNLELIAFVQTYLEGLGITCTLVHNADKSKANLFATLPGAGGVTQGGVVLSGHTDVVPVDGQAWDTNPFELTEKGGNLYGRGTCDMKGFIAVCLALVPELQRMPLRKPIHLAWSYDEEVGCLGGRTLTEYLKANNIRPDGCIVGEPTMMLPVIAHKGILVVKVVFHGKHAHSSYALRRPSCNAIDYAALLVVFIRQLAETLRDKNLIDVCFDVPYSTLSTNLIAGGNAINTVPGHCEVTYDLRDLPIEDVESVQRQITTYAKDVLLPKMKKEFSDANIQFTEIANVPSFAGTESAELIQLVRALCKNTKSNKVGFATEAGLFERVGVPTVVCGPGSITVAHQPGEHVSLDQLEKCGDFIRRLASQYACGVASSRL